MQEELKQLAKRITDLENENKLLKSPSTFPLWFQRVLVARGFIRTEGPKTGIVKANGLNTATVILGINKSVYTASVSGGAVNNNLIAQDGIITT